MHKLFLKSVKNTIKSWNSEVNGNINKKIEVVDSRIAELEDLNTHNLELNIAKEELKELLLIKDSMLKQQARIGWLQKGDRNTRFFHQAVQRKWAKNKSFKLIFQGKTMVTPEDIRNEVFLHFKSQFSKRELDSFIDIRGCLSRKLSSDDNSWLQRNISEDELDFPLNQCCSDKALGPDGINAGVLKVLWPSIKGCVLNTFQIFLNSGHLPKGMNSSFITLIPKTSG